MRLALAQLNPLVGDLPGNAQRILKACHQAASEGAELVVTPELALWGYPPRDLLLNRSRVEQQQEVMDRLSQDLAELAPTWGCSWGWWIPAMTVNIPAYSMQLP